METFAIVTVVIMVVMVGVLSFLAGLLIGGIDLLVFAMVFKAWYTWMIKNVHDSEIDFFGRLVSQQMNDRLAASDLLQLRYAESLEEIEEIGRRRTGLRVKTSLLDLPWPIRNLMAPLHQQRMVVARNIVSKTLDAAKYNN
ncbi:MAG: hypothetical protein ABH826_03810 [Patescibacteria group bacterium]